MIELMGSEFYIILYNINVAYLSTATEFKYVAIIEVIKYNDKYIIVLIDVGLNAGTYPNRFNKLNCDALDSILIYSYIVTN